MPLRTRSKLPQARLPGLHEMNVRKTLYFTYARLRGHLIVKAVESVGKEWPLATAAETAGRSLRAMLSHAQKNVPYYRDYLAGLNLDKMAVEDLLRVLGRLPVMTKDIIRRDFERLKSNDLSSRQWYYNTSGGSTGEPIRLVQDREYNTHGIALAWLAYRCMGYEYGDRKVWIWGSERDILQGSMGLRAKVGRWLENCRTLNAFRMTPEDMRRFLETMDERPARLIIAYAQALYELAQFAEAESIRVRPQSAATASAGTLYPYMRETIQRVFQCPVYNFYGSREVGLVATELPGREGLWVPPGAQYVEIVSDKGDPSGPGQVGSILVTCLYNYAMPLIRYRIGDRGAFAWVRGGQQVLENVFGREVDAFRRSDGTLIDGEYFTHLVYFRPWVQKFQFVQTSNESVVLSVVLGPGCARPPQSELNSVSEGVRKVLGPAARIEFSWVEEIPPCASGKYRYTICKC